MEYLVEGKKYNLSYSELKDNYNVICLMGDSEFMNSLPEILHLACVICYLKEIPTYVCLSDEGIIHQLVHLLHIPDDPIIDLVEIRKLFENQLKLA